MITPQDVQWDSRSSTPTGVDALGTQEFGSRAGYPRSVSGVFYPDRRDVSFPSGTPGFLVDYDAVLVSETFFDGKEGDIVTVNGADMKCVSTAVLTLPFGPAKNSHAEYALKYLGTKGGV